MTTHVYNPVLSEADAREIFYALQDEDLQLRIGPDGENLLEPEFAMTPELAQAIYSDVQTKLAAVREGFYGRDNTTREWKQHLLAILETIGDDGENLLRS